MAKRQTTLFGAWSQPATKQVCLDPHQDSSSRGPREDDSDVGCGEVRDTDSESDTDSSQAVATSCAGPCCSTPEKAFQPNDQQTLALLTVKKRNFQPQWYRQFPWLTVCISSKKAYCLYCRYAVQQSLMVFSKMGEKAFTEDGFQNWRKALEKFRSHEGSHTHREAKLKWMARGNPTIESRISSQVAQQQSLRRQGLLIQLRAVVYLTRQGIALRGHTESEGNLTQLLKVWSKDNDIVKAWLRENKFTSHQAINELIELLGNGVLRNVLRRMKEVTGPTWFAIIADEATDIVKSEQLNLSIRWVTDEYEACEDPIGLFRLPDTKAETLFKVIKDILIRCDLPIAMCRGQAYDGAANMQGKRTGLATRVSSEQPAALPVHCCAHSLNLCLQDAGRKLVCLRDALEISKEIGNLIRLSPKRLHLFSSNLQASSTGVALKPLCPTRWTARTAAIDAILKDYTLLMETLEEVHATTDDEYGLKAAGYLQSLEKFTTLFGLRLAHTLFCAAEQVSFALQKKNISLQDALSAVDAAKAYYDRLRSEEEFNRFYDMTVELAQQHAIGQPELPRYRRRPSRFEDGSAPHEYTTAKAYYRHTYFEACDLLRAELDERFDRQRLPPVLAMEQLLLKAANGDEYQTELAMLAESCYENDVDWSDLKRHLPLLQDVVKKGTPSVKKVTSIHTVCEAMNSNGIFKDMLPTVHELLRLYITVPITSATSERTFSALRRLLTYLRSSMTEKRLNNCLLLHIHKDVTDSWIWRQLQVNLLSFLMTGKSSLEGFKFPICT